MRAVRIVTGAAIGTGGVVCAAAAWFGAVIGAAEPVPRPRMDLVVMNEPAGPGGEGAGALVLADRRMIQRLREAEERIAAGDHLVAIEHLQRLVEAPEDAFYHPDSGQTGHFRSLRAEAERLIGSLPPAGRDVYERQYGPTAQQLLTEALKAGRWEPLADISRQYFHTAAGGEATYRLGVAHFDQGRELAAALCFERLRRHAAAANAWEPALSARAALAWRCAGLPESAEEAFGRLKENSLGGQLTVAGRTAALDDGLNNAETWLRATFGAVPANMNGSRGAWSMAGGGPSRNPIAAAGRAEGLEVALNTMSDPRRDPAEDTSGEIEEQIERILEGEHTSRSVHLPAMSPVTVGETVAFRTFGDVTFFDLRTREWSKSLIDLDAEPLLDQAEANGGPSKSLQQLIAQRVWSDLAYGMLSSDGRLVYCVEDPGGANASIDRRGRSSDVPRAFNRLAAYDPQDGKLVWDVGGDPRDPFFVLPLAGTFFLGPPLPLGGLLYCLAEVEGEIRLIVLEPTVENGRPVARLAWEQPLAVTPERSGTIGYDAARRMAGTAPSYADGVLICPTGVGALIAIDPTTRSLLWAQRFEAESYRPTGPVFGRRRRVRMQPARSAWAESVAIIAERKVLFTPEYEDKLYCLDLLDGSVEWSEPRGDGLYLGGVANDQALVVGTRGVRALRLADGDESWRVATGTPSGRSVIVGERMYVPLKSGEITTIGLSDGDLIRKSPLPLGGTPGNLIAGAGVLISQSPEGIETVPLYALDGDE